MALMSLHRIEYRQMEKKKLVLSQFSLQSEILNPETPPEEKETNVRCGEGNINTRIHDSV